MLKLIKFDNIFLTYSLRIQILKNQINKKRNVLQF